MPLLGMYSDYIVLMPEKYKVERLSEAHDIAQNPSKSPKSQRGDPLLKYDDSGLI